MVTAYLRFSSYVVTENFYLRRGNGFALQLTVQPLGGYGGISFSVGSCRTPRISLDSKQWQLSSEQVFKKAHLY